MKRKINVFIASPGDLATERDYFRKAIEQLNVGFGDGANVEFTALGWEDTLALTGRRNQAVINEEIDKCDVFILVMHRRWGQEALDAQPYTSYTEEEFYRAINRWKSEKKPEIFVFFKRVDAVSESDPGPQLKKVMAFRRQLEETRHVLYHYFTDESSFIHEIDRHLRAYAKDELPKSESKRDVIIFPSSALEEIEAAKTAATENAKAAEEARDAEKEAILRLAAMQLQSAEDAAELAKQGKIEFASQKFAQLLSETFDLRILYLGYEFYRRTGDLDSAVSTLEKWLSITGINENSTDTASAFGNLGNIYRIRGDLGRAEEMFQKALNIAISFKHEIGIANGYGSLGGIYRIRGEFDRAEEMYNKAITIFESLDFKEGMASSYNNLANIYRSKLDLDLAEKTIQKSLAINKGLGSQEGMASNYGTLGSIYRSRKDFTRAERMFKKSLAINKSLGRKEVIANAYGNLGNINLLRDELRKAEGMYKKALSIDESLGRKEGMANAYGNLGIIFRVRKNYEKSEDMYRKALAINESLDRKESMANGYSNLGSLLFIKGDFDDAENMFQKSLSINKYLGFKDGVELCLRRLESMNRH